MGRNGREIGGPARFAPSPLRARIAPVRIASRRGRAYCAGMILPRLMRVMTLLAVLLAPLTMMASHASAVPMPMAHAMGEPSAMSGHCPPAGDEQDEQTPTPNIDCTIMCSAMPAVDTAFAAEIIALALNLVQAGEFGGHGLNPSADPPPPRFS